MRCFLTLLLLCTTCLSSLAQDKLVLQHQKRKRKQKELSMEKLYSFRHHTDLLTFGRVTEFSNNSLTVFKYDSTEIILHFKDIEVIERDLFPNRRWLEPFGFTAIGAGLTLVATPFIWAFDNGDAAVDGLQFAGILAAVSVPPIFIATRKERYNLRKKWRLEVR